MAGKVSAAEFAAFIKERAEKKDGYIMGATGQDPSGWKDSSWWIAQYDPAHPSAGSAASAANLKKAKYWRDNAERVWDCNGLAEGYYKDVTGVDINSKARYNYASWCSIKGTGTIPAANRVPGAAVFSGSTAATISHVGFLLEPVDPGKPEGDWYVGEARSVQYGVVITKLNGRGWKWWGLMDKYFDYGDIKPIEEDPVELGDRTLRKGDKGEDVRELQEQLNALGHDCGAADGIYGAKTVAGVKSFQRERGLTADGIAGKQTYAALEGGAEVCPTCGQVVRKAGEGG